MLASRAAAALVLSWLSREAGGFSPSARPPAPSASPPPRTRTRSSRPSLDASASGSGGRRDDDSAASRGRPPSTMALRLSQSVNDDVSGFHYDQEPRGTSYISQVSKQDLWERRQMRKPGRTFGQRERRRQPAPNSRGAFTPREYDAVNGGVDGGVDGVNGRRANDGEFEAFRDSVSRNLKSMTDLLKEMQHSQSVQTNDVRALSGRVSDMAERIGTADARSRRQNNGAPNPADSSGSSSVVDDLREKNFGTSLDGEFNRKIKDVIDEFDMVQGAAAVRDRNVGSGGGEPYYREKIAQLEARIDEIDETLKATEDKVNGQMDYVDMLLDQRIEDGPFDGMHFDRPPPPGEPFMEMDEGPMPPPPQIEMEQGRFEVEQQGMPPPPPPPQQQEESGPGIDNIPPPYMNMDDGRTYFQERNTNNFNDPPPPPREIPSNQNQQQQRGGQRTKSVNTRSDAFHYKDQNTSFMSSFSKMDNDRRREFRPFDSSRDQGRRRGANEVRPGDQLPRGVVNSPNRRYASRPPPPPNAGVMGTGGDGGMGMMGMGMGMGMGYPDEPYYSEDGPMMMDGGMMMMEDEYFYGDMMY